MALACGPEMPTLATVGGFADATMDRLVGPDSRLELSLRTSPHPPNPPPFVFPAAPAPPPLAPRTTARRPLSAIESPTGTSSADMAGFGRRSSAAPLPEFSFNPGAGLKRDPSPFGSFAPPPLHRPAQPSQSRPPGGFRHRRGGSEFVGGSIRMGDSIQVTSTAGKGEAAGALGVPGPNRRHNRNRSANPSVGSVMLALQPVDGNAQARGTSAPVSPADVVATENLFVAKDQQLAAPPSIDVSLAPETPVDAEPSSAAAAAAAAASSKDAGPAGGSNGLLSLKTRVGFSEAVEYIPRPVSMVSSDTSSTATVRPSHSLTGSVTSLVSMANASTLDRVAPQPLSRTTTLERTESRPSTAGAVLDRALGSPAEQSAESLAKRRNSIPILITIPAPGGAQASEPSPTKTPKRWSFFGLEPFSSSSSPTRSRPASSNLGDGAPEPSPSNTTSASTSGSPTSPADKAAGDAGAVDSAQPPQAAKPKKKKVKKWAGAILTRKAKPRAHKSCENLRTNSPAILDMDPMPRHEVELLPELAAGPPMPVLTVTEPMASPYDVEVSRPVSAPSPDDDASYGMIDLDAAEGPFNSPLPCNPEWEAAQRAASHAKRPLHSAQGMKGFSGPGMHYHRRTESAPEMAPFEGLRGAGVLHRFGSRSTMADVFEEEEEEEEDRNDGSLIDATASRYSAHRASLPDTASTVSSEPDSDGGDVTPPATESSLATPATATSLHVPPPQESATLPKERSTPTLRQDTELAGPITFRTGNLFVGGSEGGEYAFPRRRNITPVDISPLHTPPGHQSHHPQLAPASPYPNSTASSFPSPRSQLSYDAQIISTAPSSVNEDSFHSLLMGEPGPEVRISTDDVPSLCSGASTTTRDSVILQNGVLVQPGSQADGQQQRPTSYGGHGPRRRSSVLSFARLIGSSHSHGERSKLSVEVMVNDDDEEQKPKVSRTRRLSRLMQFWKPKEGRDGKEAREVGNVSKEGKHAKARV
jgi:hypothetical protein